MTTDLLPVTDRTQVHRLRDRQVRDRAMLNEILDTGLVAHVALCLGGEPVLIPVAYARDGDRLLLHGSTGAGLLRAAAGGAPIAVAVTHIDGLVFAQSMFHSSMNYRSAVIFGTAQVLDGADRLAALHALSDHLMPGRWDEVRQPTARELTATLVLALPLDEASVKVRTGGPSEDGEEIGAWAGVLPLRLQTGEPILAVGISADVELPDSLLTLRRRLSTKRQPT
jgi:nitroimidazol reductase NimA-like FMN-containing flavoprotein (pyridoxamine 5'-phosphate oxidase superfamily)